MHFVSTNRLRLCGILLAIIINAEPYSSASAQTLPTCESTRSISYDSGDVSTSSSTVVAYEGAPWIQLDLTEVELSPRAKLILRGSNGVQELDAAALSGGHNDYSAIFEGDRVTLELVVADNDSENLRRRDLRRDEGGLRGGKGGLVGLLLGRSFDRDEDEPETEQTSSRVVVSYVKVGICDPSIAESICGCECPPCKSNLFGGLIHANILYS